MRRTEATSAIGCQDLLVFRGGRLRGRVVGEFELGIFGHIEQRYVKRHGIVATDTSPVHARSVRRQTHNVVNGILPPERLWAAKEREILFEAIANGSVVSWQDISPAGGIRFLGRKRLRIGSESSPKIGCLKSV